MSRRQKVLIIDDAEQIHHLVRARLKGLDVDVMCSATGQTGLAAAKAEMPDLVLLDVNMPGMSGFEVCKLLKDNPDTYNIPVIFLTGVDETVNKVKGFDLGAVDYVTKPFDPAELRARVRSALKTKELMDMLTTQAQIDGLTGLHNRRYFDRRLEQELAEGQRYKRPVGMLLLDIDHFKSINDTYGHPKGDQVLSKLAEVLAQTCRSSDIACRYGGEEFAIILPEAHAEYAYQSGQRMLVEIRQHPELTAILGQPVTVSIGAACATPTDRVTPAAFLHQTDQALYTSKTSGRNRVTAA